MSHRHHLDHEHIPERLFTGVTFGYLHSSGIPATSPNQNRVRFWLGLPRRIVESGVPYEVWTPNEAPQAAQVLLDLLAADAAQSHS